MFCETQLAYTIGHISHLYDLASDVDVLILDFLKAFDSVSQTKLLFKLGSLGFHSEILGRGATFPDCLTAVCCFGRLSIHTKTIFDMCG